MSAEDSARALRKTLDMERDAHKNIAEIKDPEKARLEAVFRKKRAHRDPFLHTSEYDPIISSYAAIEKDRHRSQAGDVAGMGRAGYWGVGLGAGVVIGGGVVWGMSSPDCHNEEGDRLRSNAGKLLSRCRNGSALADQCLATTLGACAVGIGPTGGGYCGTGNASKRGLSDRVQPMSDERSG